MKERASTRKRMMSQKLAQTRVLHERWASYRRQPARLDTYSKRKWSALLERHSFPDALNLIDEAWKSRHTLLNASFPNFTPQSVLYYSQRTERVAQRRINRRTVDRENVKPPTIEQLLFDCYSLKDQRLDTGMLLGKLRDIGKSVEDITAEQREKFGLNAIVERVAKRGAT